MLGFLVNLQERVRRFLPALVLVFLAFAVLWKGGKSLETTWLLLVLAWLATVVGSLRRDDGGEPLWLWAGGMLFVLWTILSYLTSSTANYGLDEVFRAAALVLLFLWAMRETGNDDRFPDRLLRALAYVAIAACIVGFAVYVLQPVNRFVGTFFDWRFDTDYWPNAWAEFVLLAWPAVLWWSSRAGEAWQRATSLWRRDLFRALLLGLPLATLFLSYSRGAAIAFGGQIALWLILRWRNGEPIRPDRSGVRQLALLGLVTLFLFWGTNLVRGQIFEVQPVGEKLTFTADEGSSSVSERRSFWEQALVLTKEKPLLGWGPYSFRFVQPRLQESVLATSDHPHNVFLKLAMERGIPAMLLWLLVVGGILIAGFWFLVSRKEPVNQQRRTRSALVVVAVAGVLAHNLIDYNLQFVGVALPFWLLLGILAAGLPAGNAPLPRLRRGFEVLLATVLLGAATVEGGYLVTSSFGRHAEARGDDGAALLWYGRSTGERFSRDLHLSRAHLFLRSGQAAEAVAAVDLYLDQNEQDGRAWKLLGDACRANRDYVCALDAYDRAAVQNRWNDLSLAQASIELMTGIGMQDAVLANQAEYDALLRAFADAIIRNAHFVALSPNADAAIAFSNFLVGLFPEDEARYVGIGAAVARAAREERAKIDARSPGFLW